MKLASTRVSIFDGFKAYNRVWRSGYFSHITTGRGIDRKNISANLRRSSFVIHTIHGILDLAEAFAPMMNLFNPDLHQ
jgi:hypothetical protein